MKNIETMDFAKTWRHFQETTYAGVTEEFASYAGSLTRCDVQDFRGKPFDKGLLDNCIKKNRFILIDGTSLAGKSSFAKKIAEEYGINVVDVDEYCLRWLEEITKKPLSRDAMIRKVLEFPKEAAERITNELESIVLSQSDGGKKAVILVGVFIYDMQRFVTLDKIGRHFSGVTSILLYEPLETLKKRFTKRGREYSGDFRSENFDKVRKDFNVVNLMLKSQLTKKYLGIGATESYVLDSKSTSVFG